MAAVLTASIAADTVTFAVAGAAGSLRVRWGDGTDETLPPSGGDHVYGDGEFRAVVVDGVTGQRIEQSVMVPAPGVPTIDSLSSLSLPAGPPSNTGLHIFGGGFGRCSQIRFGSTLEREWSLSQNHFRSANELVLEITGGLFPGADSSIPVSVLTDVPGGGESAPVDLALVDWTPPSPPATPITITSCTPSSIAEGSTQALTLTGTGFSQTDPAPVVSVTFALDEEFDGAADAGEPVVDSDTQLTVHASANLSPGEYLVAVETGAPGVDGVTYWSDAPVLTVT
jgi:hypothetical protein